MHVDLAVTLLIASLGLQASTAAQWRLAPAALPDGASVTCCRAAQTRPSFIPRSREPCSYRRLEQSARKCAATRWALP